MGSFFPWIKSQWCFFEHSGCYLIRIFNQHTESHPKPRTGNTTCFPTQLNNTYSYATNIHRYIFFMLIHIPGDKPAWFSGKCELLFIPQQPLVEWKGGGTGAVSVGTPETKDVWPRTKNGKVGASFHMASFWCHAEFWKNRGLSSTVAHKRASELQALHTISVVMSCPHFLVLFQILVGI